jgi:hypothetical protein
MLLLSVIVDVKIFLLPRWVKRVLGRVPTAPTERVSNAETVDELWNEFLEGPHLKKILKSVRARQLPHCIEDWERPLRSATRLYKELEEEGMSNIPTVYPVLCLLIKGNYYIRKSGKKGRRKLLVEDPHAELLHAAASTDFCAVGFMERLLRDYSKQMTIQIDGMTPLHIILEKSELSSAVLKIMIEASPAAASIPYKEEFPFQQACRRGYMWETGLKELFNAHPDAIQATEVSPFYLAALSHANYKEKQERIQLMNYQAHYHQGFVCFSERATRAAERERTVLNTLFEILSKDPTCVQQIKTIKPREKYYYNY